MSEVNTKKNQEETQDLQRKLNGTIKMLIFWFVISVTIAYILFAKPDIVSKYTGINMDDAHIYGYGSLSVALFDLFFIFSVSRVKRLKEKR